MVLLGLPVSLIRNSGVKSEPFRFLKNPFLAKTYGFHRNPVGMRKQAPKDVNNQLGSAMGLDPNDPNDMAFKLVTIFFVSQKLTFF